MQSATLLNSTSYQTSLTKVDLWNFWGFQTPKSQRSDAINKQRCRNGYAGARKLLPGWVSVWVLTSFLAQSLLSVNNLGNVFT